MTEHLDELLSAHLDGELTVEEAAAVDAHLAECAACRAELEATRGVRTALRDAPPVDPPFGFIERLVPTRRRPRWPAAAAVVGVAAAWILVLGFVATPPRADVVPPVNELRVELTDGDVTGASDPIQINKPLIAGLHKVDPTATPLPSSVIRLPRSRAFRTKDGNGVLVVFEQSTMRVLVYVQRGDAKWSTLQGGLRSPVPGVAGTPWESTDPNPTHALVYEVDGTTVIVVGDLPQDQLEQVAREVGKPTTASPSFGDRLRDGAASVMDAFSLR